MKKIIKFVPLIILLVIVEVTTVYAGNLTPPENVARTMYTLSDIYNLSQGEFATLPSGSINTPSSVSSSFKTLGQVYDAIHTEIIKLSSAKIAKNVSAFGYTGTLYGDTNGAKVLSSAIYAGTMVDNSGVADFTPGNSNVSIPIGFYDGITKISGDADLITDNIKNGVNIFGIDGKGSVVDTSDSNATEGDILSGLTAYVNGIKITGNLSTQTLLNTSDSVSSGFYNATTLSTIDTDLSASNIKSGVNIFGINGSLSTGTNYSLPKTGQTSVYQAGDDGSYQKGFSGVQLVDNENNTITDNATGLMWKKCSEGQSGPACAGGNATLMTWINAINACEADSTGSFTDWRLPNILELYTILNFESSGTAWINVSFFPATKTTAQYWTGTTSKGTVTSAMGVSFSNGGVGILAKTSTYYVRCVR